MKQRIAYIDIAKGLLMICLLLAHLGIRALNDGRDDAVIQLIMRTMGLYNAFFMPTFFLITGYCTTFSVDAKTFVWKNVKGLILPAIFITLIFGYICDAMVGKEISLQRTFNLLLWLRDKGPWFVVALFWCKLLFYVIQRLRLRLQVVVIALLYAAGLALSHYHVLPNYWYHRHVFLLLPFLFVGHNAKGRLERLEPYYGYVSLFAVLFILGQNVLGWLNIWYLPSLDHYIRISFFNWPIHFVNVLAGSIMVLYLSKKVGTSSFLSTLGRGSLLIYLCDFFLYLSVTRLLSLLFVGDSLLTCALYHGLTMVGRVGLAYLLIRLIYDHKYTSWIVGKW